MLLRFLRTRINITKENRVHFWTIFTTAAVGIFSIWLGLAVQDDINKTNAVETQKLARYQMVETVYPRFEKYMDTCGPVFLKFMDYAEDAKQSPPNAATVESLGKYFLREQIMVEDAMLNSVNMLSSNKYYFAEESRERICKNNVAILFGMQLLESDKILLDDLLTQKQKGNSISGSVVCELRDPYYTKHVIPYRKTVEEEICRKCNNLVKTTDASEMDTNSLVNKIVYDFVFLPYIDNFDIFINELSAGQKYSNRFGIHIIMLFVCIILGFCLCLLILRIVFGVRIFIQKEEPNKMQYVDQVEGE